MPPCGLSLNYINFTATTSDHYEFSCKDSERCLRGKELCLHQNCKWFLFAPALNLNVLMKSRSVPVNKVTENSSALHFGEGLRWYEMVWYGTTMIYKYRIYICLHIQSYLQRSMMAHRRMATRAPVLRPGELLRASGLHSSMLPSWSQVQTLTVSVPVLLCMG